MKIDVKLFHFNFHPGVIDLLLLVYQDTTKVTIVERQLTCTNKNPDKIHQKSAHSQKPVDLNILYTVYIY